MDSSDFGGFRGFEGVKRRFQVERSLYGMSFRDLCSRVSVGRFRSYVYVYLKMKSSVFSSIERMNVNWDSK